MAIIYLLVFRCVHFYFMNIVFIQTLVVTMLSANYIVF
jgi:hypothetical protein